MTNNNEQFEYAGFWIIVWASIIDTFLIFVITMPILFSILDFFKNNDLSLQHVY